MLLSVDQQRVVDISLDDEPQSFCSRVVNFEVIAVFEDIDAGSSQAIISFRNIVSFGIFLKN